MNADIKKQWVAALRSGEYKQGRGLLKDAAGNMCCLGVLCDLHAKATGNAWSPDGSYLGRAMMPVCAVWAWAGLIHQNLDVEIDGIVKGVADHNDGVVALGAQAKDVSPRTFAEIADAIEAQA